MNSDLQHDAFATLVHLAKRSREAGDKAELSFVITNETYALLHYRQAVLWFDGNVATLSGVATPEANAPYVLWLNKVLNHLASISPVSPLVIHAHDLPANLAEEWNDWLPSEVLWSPLSGIDHHTKNGLLLARDEIWTEAEIALLTEWLGLWGQAWRLQSKSNAFSALLRSSNPQKKITLRTFKLLSLAVFLIAMFIPVPLRVLAPAELVPINPAVIRAPLDGVVGRVLVSPNQIVKQNDALIEFDRAGVQNKLQVAQRAIATLQAEYKQKAQQSIFDSSSKAALAPLQGQIAEKSMEINYLRHLNNRGVVVAPQDGVVLLDDQTEWIGRPVVTGEKIMMIADPSHLEIEAWLTLSDAINFPENTKVRLFLNTDPLEPVYAKLRYVSHEAIERPDQSYAYRTRLTLDSKSEKVRLGLKGVARIEGQKVALGYWIIRRPLAALRSWAGV